MCTMVINDQCYTELSSYQGMKVLQKEKQLFLLFTEINLLIPGKVTEFSTLIKEKDDLLKFNGFEFPIQSRTPLPPRSERIGTEIEGISLSLYIERSNRTSRFTSVKIA